MGELDPLRAAQRRILMARMNQGQYNTGPVNPAPPVPPLTPTPNWPFRLSATDRDFLRVNRIKVD